MLLTQKKFNGMKDRIANLEGQVEALTHQKVEEKNKKLKEIGNLDDKIVYLETEKRNLKNDIKDVKAEKSRSEEDIKHKVKIVMEKHDLDLEKKKNALVLEKDKEIAKVKDEYRDKRESQLEKQSDDMRGMYTDVLDKLTKVTGTLSNPARLQENANNTK